MADTMVERAARRLFWMNGQYAERGMRTWAEATPLVREKFMKEAREVIEELREPTESMVHYGFETFLNHEAGTEIVPIWQAMIDEASGAEPGQPVAWPEWKHTRDSDAPGEKP